MSKGVSKLSSALANVNIKPQEYEEDQMSDAESDSQSSRQAQLDRVGQYLASPPASGITLFSHRSAPNGYKVAVVLAELGIKWQTFYIDLKKNEQRSPSYVRICPNARIPCIIDHDNEDHSVWESGAILQYLCQRQSSAADEPCPLYDANFLVQSKINSWMYFQASGCAPMIGQALHFRYFHHEYIGSAVDRYCTEVRRLYSVVEMHLAEKREQYIVEMDEDSFILGTTPLSESKFFDEPVWLVGDSITIADLSFVTWNHVVEKISINLHQEFPEVYKWTRHMMKRPAVVRALTGSQ